MGGVRHDTGRSAPTPADVKDELFSSLQHHLSGVELVLHHGEMEKVSVPSTLHRLLGPESSGQPASASSGNKGVCGSSL